MNQTKNPEGKEQFDVQPVAPTTPDQVSAVRGTLRNQLDIWQRATRIIDAMRYRDAQTGYFIQEVKQGEMSASEVGERNEFLHFGLQNGRKLTLTVSDATGKPIGTYTKNIFVSQDNQLFIEDDESIMNTGGTGFGTRFQEHLEQSYRDARVTAAFRGCGLAIGRYEGAALGYDFIFQQQRDKFRRGFVQFLRENGVQKVTFYQRILPVEELEEALRTAQDFLAVRADRPIPYVLDGKWEECPAEKAGKAFFLDQESQSKRELDPDNAYRGKWVGIKYFAP